MRNAVAEQRANFIYLFFLQYMIENKMYQLLGQWSREYAVVKQAFKIWRNFSMF